MEENNNWIDTVVDHDPQSSIRKMSAAYESKCSSVPINLKKGFAVKPYKHMSIYTLKSKYVII